MRLSHLLGHCSVGAIVRDSDRLMVVPDIREWGRDPRSREIRYVDQVRSALGITQTLCKPPIAREQAGRVLGWIPAYRFPLWMRCLGCGLMHRAPWRKREEVQHGGPEANAVESTQGKCVCGGKLEQAPWVLVHEDGYLADVPWHELAHPNARNPNQRQCRADWTPYLKLVERAGRRQVECTRCESSGGLPSRWPFPPHSRQQPWIREPPAETLATPAWLMEINDVRVHSAVSRTALVIPPESRIRRGTITDRLYGSSRHQQRIRNANNRLARKGAIRRIATEFGCAPGDIKEAMAEIDAGYPLYGEAITGGDLLRSEYQALTEPIPDLKEDEDFVTEHHTAAWQAVGSTLAAGAARRTVAAVSRLVAVNKLKEIMVLLGFRRAGGERTTPPDIARESDWLPAMELYGEGIFFTLDEPLLQRWERSDALHERADAFAQRYVQRAGLLGAEVEVSPRFLLCHALAHILIRRLEAEAGYPAASLKERIYCATGKEPMAGILIYVAVADEEGSLGGLMELARPDRFLRLLTGAFEAAQWCSLDPVCADQEGHGPDLLNRAACHACVLVPETSCQYGNVLLDRTFIKGDGADVSAFLDCVESPD